MAAALKGVGAFVGVVVSFVPGGVSTLTKTAEAVGKRLGFLQPTEGNGVSAGVVEELRGNDEDNAAHILALRTQNVALQNQLMKLQTQVRRLGYTTAGLAAFSVYLYTCSYKN